MKVRVFPTSPFACRKKCVSGFVVPRRWIVASETTFRLFEMIGSASETSNAVGYATRDERGELVDRRLNRVHRRDHILPSAQQLRVVVREDGRHLPEVEPFYGVERESLHGEPDRHAARADRFGPFCQNRSEALGRALEHACARIEMVGKAGRR